MGQMLKEVVQVIEMYEAHKTIETTLRLLRDPRLKITPTSNICFSPRLNNFISDWFRDHKEFFKFVDEDDFDGEDIEGTHAKHLKRWKEEGVIKIWTGASDHTIFSSPAVNHMFRAWHDYTHMTEELGYDFMGETAVCNIQQAQLPLDWGYEKALINSEIVGQALHFMKFGDFCEDQRAFTLDFMETGRISKQF